MTGNTITIQDPRNPQVRRTFTFDYAYWSHSGFIRNRDGLFVAEEPGGRYADQVMKYPASHSGAGDFMLDIINTGGYALLDYWLSWLTKREL